MIPAAACTAIVIAFILIFGVIIPILNKKIPDYVSYRWCVVVVVLSLAVGVTIDFGELSESSRGTILTGARYLPAGTYKAFCKIAFTGEASFFDQPIFVQRVG